MKAKTKLVATIMAMCLVISLGVIGILAVKTLNMSVGGNITFSADGLALEVSQGVFKTDDDAEYTNITTQSGKLQAFTMNTDTKLSDIQSKIDSWSNLELALDSKGDAILHFSVTNKMTTPLYVYITTNLGTNTNNNMDLIVSPNGTEIGAGLTTNFAITFDIIDTNINAGLTGFAVDVDFEKEEKKVELNAQYKIDTATGLPTTEIDYYYVEMGTYNGQPVRWRYVADSNGTRYDGTNPLTSSKGYYVLETQMKLSAQYYSGAQRPEGYTSISDSDYGLSDMRKYLSGGFMEALGITTSDPIYSMIPGRTIADLYSTMSYYDGEPITQADKGFCLSLTGDKDISNQKDKLWLMSSSEAENFFADASLRGWHTEKDVYYWTRSPGGGAGSDSLMIIKSRTASYLSAEPTKSWYVRPAFKI